MNNEDIEIQLSELHGENIISSKNKTARIKLGLSESIIHDTNFRISSNTAVNNTIPELIVCHKKVSSFELKKEDPEVVNRLRVEVEQGELLELSKMSWIDSLKLKR